MAQRREDGLVEPKARVTIRDPDGDMIEHSGLSYVTEAKRRSARARKARPAGEMLASFQASAVRR